VSGLLGEGVGKGIDEGEMMHVLFLFCMAGLAYVLWVIRKGDV